MFGQPQGGATGSTGSTNSFGGSLFGQTAASTGGNSLFSSQGTQGTAQATGGTGLFGQKPQQQSQQNQQSGGIFGAAGTVTGAGGLFGPNTPAPAAGSTPSLFGQPPQVANGSGTQAGTQSTQGTQNTQTGGLFSKPAFSTSNGSTNTGSLFGAASNGAGTAAPAGNSLFGNPSGTSSATGTLGGLFGSNNGAAGTSLFGGSAGASAPNAASAAASTAASTAASIAVPTASASNGAPASSLIPAPLYASIDAPAFDFLNSVPSPKLYTSLSKRREIKESVPAAAQPEEPKPVAEPAPKRKLMNDYKEFMDIRPTNLHIKRQRVIVGKSRAPRSVLPAPTSSTAPGTAPASLPAPQINLFNGDITTVTVNKKALEQGYYMRPSLDELIGYSKTQLKAVKNFIVGRAGFGQIEYSDPVDLSSLANLGDIMGTLVVFTLGAVSVYPEESRKAEEGKELNKPAVVTIEQIYPRDTSNELLSPSDPRMGKFVEALKTKCSSRGAEFLTFTQGVWVFKVPHFSTWGIDLDDMIVDDDQVPADVPMVLEQYAQDDDEFPTSDFASAVQTSVSNKILPFLEAKTAPVSPKQAPLKWGDLLGSDNVLRANSAMIEASPANVRKALFQGASINHAPKAPQPVEHVPAPTPLDLETLEKFSSQRQRQGSDLPLLVTSMAFSDLMVAHPDEAWGIVAMLFDTGDVKSLLSSWLSSTIGPLPGSLRGLDAAWWLVVSHRLDQAVELAVAAGRSEIAITIAGLGQAGHSGGAPANAQLQLADLRAAGRLGSLSEAERKILEVAAGNFDTAVLEDGTSLEILAGLSWKQRVGVRLWYGEASVEEILESIQATSDNNTELAMLKLAGGPGPQNLAALLDLVDAGMGFLILQALGQQQQQRELADKLYRDYTLALLEGQQLRWAVFVALHSSDDRQARELVERVLKEHPTFSDPLIPRSLEAKALASHAHAEKRFLDETNLLLECDAEQAKQVYLSEVAPRAVVAGDLGQLAQFEFGGVYQDFAAYVKAPSDERALALAASIAKMPLDSLVSKAAAATMSHAVASSPALSTARVLQLPLHDGVASIVCKRTFDDLRGDR